MERYALVAMCPALLLSTLLLAPHAPFVSVEEAAQLVAARATVLDARDAGDFKKGHLPGAVHVDWKDFRDGWGRTGRVDDDDRAIARKLGALGLDDARPVLVYGAARGGWGEEGRVAWMLEYVGLQGVKLLDGGFPAWSRAERPVEAGRGTSPTAGHVSVHRQAGLRAELADVERATHDPRTLILDARTQAEWDGATPYYEARGGRIPAAHHLEWSALLDGDGKLLGAAELVSKLVGAGAAVDRPVIVYCTGGVRSAFVVEAMRSAGFHDVRNFDGSFWQWAKHRELPVAERSAP